MAGTITEARAIPSLPPLKPSVETSTMLDNMRSALARGLPVVKMCNSHKHELCIVGGGPSLADTYKKLKGYIAAINGSLSFLLERGVIPNACGVLDANRHMAEIVEPHQDVTYYVASVCNPAVFDKLKNCHVILWHPSGIAD